MAILEKISSIITGHLRNAIYLTNIENLLSIIIGNLRKILKGIHQDICIIANPCKIIKAFSKDNEEKCRIIETDVTCSPVDGTLPFTTYGQTRQVHVVTTKSYFLS